MHFFLFQFLVFSTILNAQNREGVRFIPEADSLQNGFHMSYCFSNHFKNNEYFNDIYTGRTFLGNNSAIVANFKNKYNVASFGALSQFQFGKPLRYKVFPIISLNNKVGKYFSITFGALNGGINHDLPLEILGLDYNLENPIEYGLSLKWDSPRIKIESWINWIQNIRENDSFQEQFFQAQVIRFRPFINYFDFLELKAGAVFSHFGGQIDSNDLKVITHPSYFQEALFNFNKKAPIKYFIKISFFQNQNNLNSDGGKGSATSFSISSIYSNFYGELALKNFKKYNEPFGELFYNYLNSNTLKRIKNENTFFVGLLSYNLVNDKNFLTKIQTQLFYDLNKKKISYNYFVNIRFNIIK